MHGVIKVAREFPELLGPYKKDRIPNILGAVDHSVTIGKKDFKRQIKVEETELNHLVRQLKDRNLSAIFLLMGRDGSGKTGTTSCIVDALGYDYKIVGNVPIGPPSEEELAHSWLWKYIRSERWPAIGQIRIFDRGWPERVLVEKVMKLTKPDLIHESYGQMRLFEKLLTEQGIVLVKLWLDITSEEQERRFEERRKSKPWKVSKSDAIARAHWDDYTPAANELFHLTGSTFAPWNIISSENKPSCRVKVLRVINKALRARLSA
jgi:polyphosphate kinase 2 (PPK2 family)